MWTLKTIINEEFQNSIYFGAYIFENDNRVFALSFGKSHFYIRPFADNEFRIEVAKRIANENDVKQTSSKRYSGKERKKIRNFQKDTTLDIESGETLDYLSASIIPEYQQRFGKSAKFGSSLHITPEIQHNGINNLLNKIEEVLAEEERFKIPRTIKITRPESVSVYDAELLNAIKSGNNAGGFTSESYETIGVDFVFSGSSETYRLIARRNKSIVLQELNIDVLRAFIHQYHIDDDNIFDIRVERTREGERTWTDSLKKALDFTSEQENVILSQGEWLQFNEDYVNQLNEYVDALTIEPVEECFQDISIREPDFIESQEILELGYQKAHKDFSKITLAEAPATKIEAWDLIKGTTVFAVKYGTPQKLGYVCDQAMAVLEILRNKASVKKLEEKIESYCLWLVYDAQTLPTFISQSDLVILKQKIEAWARKCQNVGITPKLKISRKVKLDSKQIEIESTD